MAFTAEEQHDFDQLAAKTFEEFTDEELERFRRYLARQHVMDEAAGWAEFRRATEAAQRRLGELDIVAANDRMKQQSTREE